MAYRVFSLLEVEIDNLSFRAAIEVQLALPSIFARFYYLVDSEDGTRQYCTQDFSSSVEMTSAHVSSIGFVTEEGLDHVGNLCRKYAETRRCAKRMARPCEVAIDGRRDSTVCIARWRNCQQCCRVNLFRLDKWNNGI